MPRILKSNHYRDTDARTMGVRILRSELRQVGENGSFRTPPGLTLEEWRDRVAQIEAEARRKALEIIRRAEDEAKRIEVSVREEGYSKGHARGYTEGYEKAMSEATAQCKAEWDNRLECLSHLIDDMTGFRSSLVEQYRSEIIDIVIEVARTVISFEADRDDRTVLAVIDACLRKASSPSTLRIKTNVADLAVVTEAKREIASRFPAVQSVEVIDDASVERGGCLIEMDNGFLDARIDHQLNLVREAMVNSFEGSGHE